SATSKAGARGVRLHQFIAEVPACCPAARPASSRPSEQRGQLATPATYPGVNSKPAEAAPTATRTHSHRWRLRTAGWPSTQAANSTGPHRRSRALGRLRGKRDVVHDG